MFSLDLNVIKNALLEIQIYMYMYFSVPKTVFTPKIIVLMRQDHLFRLSLLPIVL